MSRFTKPHESFVAEALEQNSADLLRYMIRRFENQSDAAEAYGDAVETVWRKRNSVPATPERARMWMFGVARNIVRSSKRKATAHNESLNDLANILRISVQHSSNDDDALNVREALGILKPSDRELIVLIHWDGFTQQDAARIMKLNQSTARSRYSRALSELRTYLLMLSQVEAR